MLPLPRQLLCFLLPLTLAACFVSEAPLFSEKEADYPIADGARFSVQSINPDGTPKADAPQDVIVTRQGVFYLYSVTGEDESLRGMLDDLGDGNYAAVSLDGDGAMYGLYQRRGEKWMRHSMNCADFEALAAEHGKDAASFGIESDGNECQFSNYEDLKRALLFEAQYGAPDAEYTPVR